MTAKAFQPLTDIFPPYHFGKFGYAMALNIARYDKVGEGRISSPTKLPLDIIEKYPNKLLGKYDLYPGPSDDERNSNLVTAYRVLAMTKLTCNVIPNYVGGLDEFSIAFLPFIPTENIQTLRDEKSPILYYISLGKAQDNMVQIDYWPPLIITEPFIINAEAVGASTAVNLHVVIHGILVPTKFNEFAQLRNYVRGRARRINA